MAESKSPDPFSCTANLVLIDQVADVAWYGAEGEDWTANSLRHEPVEHNNIVGAA